MTHKAVTGRATRADRPCPMMNNWRARTFLREGLFAAGIVLVLALGGCGGSRLSEELPVGNVDTPKPGASAKASLRFSGWALSNVGIVRIDVYLDGKFAASSQTGVNRPDVRTAYPSYRDNENPGFDFQVDLRGKSAGPHELTVQARSRDGAVRELYRYPVILSP